MAVQLIVILRFKLLIRKHISDDPKFKRSKRVILAHNSQIQPFNIRFILSDQSDENRIICPECPLEFQDEKGLRRHKIR